MNDRNTVHFDAFMKALEELGRYRVLLRLLPADSVHRPRIEHDIKNQEQIAFLTFGEAVREAELDAINRDWEDIK